MERYITILNTFNIQISFKFLFWVEIDDTVHSTHSQCSHQCTVPPNLARSSVQEWGGLSLLIWSPLNPSPVCSSLLWCQDFDKLVAAEGGFRGICTWLCLSTMVRLGLQFCWQLWYANWQKELNSNWINGLAKIWREEKWNRSTFCHMNTSDSVFITCYYWGTRRFILIINIILNHFIGKWDVWGLMMIF